MNKSLCLLLLTSTCTAPAEETKIRTAQGTAYIAAKYYGIQVDGTDAVISDPGSFEGEHPLEFERGHGLGLALGVTSETDWCFVGAELEFLFNSSELSRPLPEGTVFESLNELEQRAINLNVQLGSEIYDRFRPHVFAGFGYTESELIGSYGMAQASLEDGRDSTFTYHAGAGIDVQLVGGLYLNAGYRLYDAGNPSTNTRGQTMEYSNSGQMYHVGLNYIYKFKPIEYTSISDFRQKSREQWKIE